MAGFKAVKLLISFLLISYGIWLVHRYFHLDEFLGGVSRLIGSPLVVLLMFICYLAAFWLRAYAWRLYLKKDIGISHYLYALFYSLLVNHLLPVKAGDLIRIGYFVNLDADVRKRDVIQSVVLMRIFDLFILGMIALSGGLLIGYRVSPKYFVTFVLLLAVSFLALLVLARKKTNFRIFMNDFSAALFSLRGIFLFFIIMVSWVFESAVLFGAAHIYSITLNAGESIWVNSVTIAGQVFHFTPGGLGTYEATMSAALTAAGVGVNAALNIALLSHLFKFLFSFVMGSLTWIKAPVSTRKISSWLKQKKEVNQT